MQVPRALLSCVPSGEEHREAAKRHIYENGFIVVPTTSQGGSWIDGYWSKGSAGDDVRWSAVTVENFIPDSTTVESAFRIFLSHLKAGQTGWFFTLEGNVCAGLVTYWDFNRYPLKMMMYRAFSELEVILRQVCEVGARLEGKVVIDYLGEERALDVRRRIGQLRSTQDQCPESEYLTFKETLHVVRSCGVLSETLELGGRNKFDSFFAPLESLRNQVAHNRDVISTQADLEILEGHLVRLMDTIARLRVVLGQLSSRTRGLK